MTKFSWHIYFKLIQHSRVKYSILAQIEPNTSTQNQIQNSTTLNKCRGTRTCYAENNNYAERRKKKNPLAFQIATEITQSTH